MQGIAIVINSQKRLQRRPDIVKIDFLGVQGTSRRLNMVFQFLAPFIGSVFIPSWQWPKFFLLPGR